MDHTDGLSMKDAFYPRVNAYIEALNKRKRDKYVINTDNYKQIVRILTKKGGNLEQNSSFRQNVGYTW